MRPLILLSPAKNLSVEGALTPALSAAKPTQCIFLEQSRALLDSAKALSKPELKKLMKLSDSLTTLNYDRFAGFEAQPSRVAIGSFYGMVNPPLAAHALLAYQRTSPPIPSMTSHLRIDPNVRDRYVSNSQGGFVTVPQAYKGLDAPTLDIPALDYLQSSLRILCGLYGIVRPYDEIKPYLFFMPFFFLTTFFSKKRYRPPVRRDQTVPFGDVDQAEMWRQPRPVQLLGLEADGGAERGDRIWPCELRPQRCVAGVRIVR